MSEGFLFVLAVDENGGMETFRFKAENRPQMASALPHQLADDGRPAEYAA